MPVEILSVPDMNVNDPPMINCLSFNKNQPHTFAFGDSNGMVHIWELTSTLVQDESEGNNYFKKNYEAQRMKLIS